MRILVDIGHPGHVHFYKHIIWNLQKRGHEVLVSARDKDVTLSLLDYYGFPYKVLSTLGNGQWGLYKEFLQREWALIRLIRDFEPDIVTEIGGLFIAPVCKLLGKSSIVFTDSEPVPVDKYLTYPFANAICTPNCFMRDLGKRHVRYKGYHEIAYLHPSYFQPDASIFDQLDIPENDPFIVIRFVAWKASHDMGQHGFSLSMKRKIMQTLSRYGRIFITSETPLPAEFESYRITLPPHKVHDLLYYAKLFLGDGATMATEASLLGTPAVRSSSMALNMGNFVELMNRYELVYSYYEPEQALQRAVELLECENAKNHWKQKRSRLFEEMIDVTAWATDFIENFSDGICEPRVS